MSADVQSSPKVVTDHQTGAARVQSVPAAPPPPSQMSRRTSGRLQQQQQQHRRSNGGLSGSASSSGACGGGGKAQGKTGGAGGGGSRKRSQSFSGGGGNCVAGVGGGGFGGKMFPSYKRRKKDHIIPPTKFLLGGNICDPLNLNSLLDEDINRAMNAVTPKSSPLPTPKHRKGKVEVIIPPNINDPLNLLQMSADGAGDDDADYEKSLISPVKAGGTVGGGGGGGAGGGGNKRNKRKRRHTKSFSANDEIGLGVATGGDEARLHEADIASAKDGCRVTTSAESAAMEVATITTMRQQARANLKLDLHISRGGGGDEEIKKAVDSCGTTTPTKAKTNSCGDVGTTDHSPTIGSHPALDTSVQLAAVAADLAAAAATATVTSSTTVVTSSASAAASVTSSTRPAVTSSTGGGGGHHPSGMKKCRKDSKDKIVSPAIPQPGAWGDKSYHHHHHRFRPHASGPHRLTPHIDKNQKTPKFKEVNTRFRYGNYNRYYGYRNPAAAAAAGGGAGVAATSVAATQQQRGDPSGGDPRLRVLLKRRDLFEARDVLDIGCNVGHVTLAVARDLNPRSIVGVDIDGHLVEAAKRNVKHYVVGGGGGGAACTVDGRLSYAGKLPYPAAMPVMYGPLDAPAVEGGESRFPYNVSFVQGNYVLDSDALLSLDERCQFDTILCLSVTKWFHLNWGDAGLKRAFRRMYAQLRPGGRLILEPQPWHSYKKKRNLTPEIWQNYKSIELFPHKFSQFLLSEVGFAKCEVVGTPHHHAKGFQRPIKLFTKGEASSAPCSVRTASDEAAPQVVVVVTSSLGGGGQVVGESVAEKSGNSVAENSGNSVAEKSGNSVAEKSGNSVAEKSGNSVAEKSGNSVAEKSGNSVESGNNLEKSGISVESGNNKEESGNSVEEKSGNRVAEKSGNSVESGNNLEKSGISVENGNNKEESGNSVEEKSGNCLAEKNGNSVAEKSGNSVAEKSGNSVESRYNQKESGNSVGSGNNKEGSGNSVEKKSGNTVEEKSSNTVESGINKEECGNIVEVSLNVVTEKTDAETIDMEGD